LPTKHGISPSFEGETLGKGELNHVEPMKYWFGFVWRWGVSPSSGRLKRENKDQVDQVHPICRQSNVGIYMLVKRSVCRRCLGLALVWPAKKYQRCVKLRFFSTLWLVCEQSLLLLAR
jgi:hypothetical protein